MRMQHVGPPVPGKRHDGIGVGGNLAPFAQARRAADGLRCAVEAQPFAGLLRGTSCRMAWAGDPAHLQPVIHLGAHDRTGAEGIAAVQRKRMVENMKHAHSVGLPSADVLNGPSTPPC